MRPRIQKLSPLLINQISAGEVVTRPASVVKELIENAIDAHATHIRIDIEQGGLGLIQITDNGDGIHPDDMILAVTRHATSKLADVEQLTGIDSLGFRGEALASIVAVSHLTLSSSADNTGIGQQLSLSGSTAEHAQLQPIVKSQGTTVSVRDLYYNVPARRSHLKSIATEFHHIEQVVQKIAISFADIHIELYHQNKLRLLLNAQQNHNQKSAICDLNRLEQALNQSLSSIAEEIYIPLNALQTNNPEKTENCQITGWLFLPNDKQLSDNLPKLIYINQRLVTDLSISQTMQKIARQTGIQSFGYALFFQLPKEWINVNVHPSKQQVKIQPLTNILAYLNQNLLEQLKNHAVNTPQPTVEKNTTIVQKTEIQYPTAETSQQKNKQKQVNENVATYLLGNQLSINIEHTDELPIILSIVKQIDDFMVFLHYQNHLYMINSNIINQKNLAINKVDIEKYLQENFNKNGQFQHEKLVEWLQKAKKVEYDVLLTKLF